MDRWALDVIAIVVVVTLCLALLIREGQAAGRRSAGDPPGPPWEARRPPPK